MSINPQGTFGKDWDSETVVLRNGAQVRITASNQTKTNQSGNKSSIALYVNDEKINDVTNHSAQVSISYDIKADGEYEIVAIGDNERADAYSVSISVTEIGKKVFG